MPEDAPHEDPEIVSRNARYGLAFFLIYLLAYAGFVALSAFAPSVMAAPAIAGVNVAVVYGFGLIALALALAVVHMALCARARGGGA